MSAGMTKSAKPALPLASAVTLASTSENVPVASANITSCSVSPSTASVPALSASTVTVSPMRYVVWDGVIVSIRTWPWSIASWHEPRADPVEQRRRAVVALDDGPDASVHVLRDFLPWLSEQPIKHLANGGEVARLSHLDQLVGDDVEVLRRQRRQQPRAKLFDAAGQRVAAAELIALAEPPRGIVG